MNHLEILGSKPEVTITPPTDFGPVETRILNRLVEHEVQRTKMLPWDKAVAVHMLAIVLIVRDFAPVKAVGRGAIIKALAEDLKKKLQGHLPF